MIRHFFKSLFQDRNKSFSAFWFEIAKTRFVLGIIIALFAAINPDIGDSRAITLYTALYILFILSLGMVDANALQLKRMRVIPAIIDVVFISLIVHFAAEPGNSWYLLYLFPIMSVSRYLGYKGSIALATFVIMAYAVVSFFVTRSHTLDGYSFALRCLIFFGVAAFAGNLTRTRQMEEEKFIRVFEEIDNAILSKPETDKILGLILNKAMAFTSSDMGQLKLFDAETEKAKTITAIGEHQNYEKGITELTDNYSKKLLESKKPLFISVIKRERLKQDLDISFGSYLSLPKSALFVPLMLNDEFIGIIAVYSRKRFHYTDRESKKLRSFASLIAMAEKSSELHNEIASVAQKRKDRVKILREVAEQLRAEQGLAQLFDKVVELSYKYLNSEEAALFVPDHQAQGLIKKEAVKGPRSDITKKLKSIEESYQSGTSLAGRIFASKELYHSNDVSPKVKYVDEYSKALPSGKISHYIGVPLIIGEEVMGVIRVINKRSRSYSSKAKNYELSDKGFDEEDIELMQAIATHAESAIRNTSFIEAQRHFQNLLVNSPDPIIVLDEKGRIIIFNKACETIWGYSFDEVNGKPVENYYESKRHARAIGRSLWDSESHRIQNFEASIKGAEGEIIPISLSASLLFNKDGKSIGSMGIFRDLREIKRLQDEKTRAEKLAAIGKLAHTVGHDIKHDIATVLNYVEVLAYECEDDPELLGMYTDIKDALSDAVSKLQNMLMTAKPKPPQMRIISLEGLFQGIEESMRRQANARQVEFLTNYPKDDYELTLDAEQVRGVLVNLFNNSLYAIEEKKRLATLQEKGRIEVTAEINQEYVHLFWKDNGCGIPRQNISSVFTPFFTSKESGSGLGLYTVKSIIENHGGHISVESEEGKTTSFEITLPLFEKYVAAELNASVRGEEQ